MTATSLSYRLVVVFNNGIGHRALGRCHGATLVSFFSSRVSLTPSLAPDSLLFPPPPPLSFSVSLALSLSLSRRLHSLWVFRPMLRSCQNFNLTLPEVTDCHNAVLETTLSSSKL